MEKLQLIKHALEPNPNIVIVKVEEHNYLPERGGKWSHVVNFIVAPKNGIYAANQLQEFMMTLVPNLKPTTIHYFCQYVEVMDFGSLYFVEEIGQEKVIRTITLTDKNLLDTEDFRSGQRIIESKNPLLRCIGILLYPNIEIASIAPNKGFHNRMNRWWIFLDELKKFQEKEIKSSF